MIILDIETYCQTCKHFEPVVSQRPETLFADGCARESVGDTVVVCKHKETCGNIYAHLRSSIQPAHKVTYNILKRCDTVTEMVASFNAVIIGLNARNIPIAKVKKYTDNRYELVTDKTCTDFVVGPEDSIKFKGLNLDAVYGFKNSEPDKKLLDYITFIEKEIKEEY